jgi:hypothetical protein
MSARTLDAARQDSIKPAASGNLSGRHLGLDISRAPSLQANSSGKHGGRRMSGTFHRRNSSAAGLPPVDMLAAEAGVYKALTDEEKQQLNEDGEVTRFVKACNGNQAEVRLRTSPPCSDAMQCQGCRPHGGRLIQGRVAATRPDNALQALKRLRATFKWRAQELPRTLRCTICDGNPKAHFMHVVSVVPNVLVPTAQANSVKRLSMKFVQHGC